jgi:hypothetical protein
MAESETEAGAMEKARPVSPGAFEEMERSMDETCRAPGCAAEDGENGKAELRDGMLELRLPKTVKSKRKRIEINSQVSG